MRIINLRFRRICRLMLILMVFISLIYILIRWSDEYKESYLMNSRKLVKGLGNFEPKVIGPHLGPIENSYCSDKSSDERELANASEREYGMNIRCSDKISMHRSVPDTRMEECQHWDYPYELPTTSVIIIFYNEGFSVLLRTVHSVIDRSPKQMLYEIILVDDFSDKENLKSKLDEYVTQFNGLVKIIRNTKREGLIRTRLRGVMRATGEVIVFLDAHCEVNKNWLPPLLAPIYSDHTVMTVPIIDSIDHRNFKYVNVYGIDNHYRGIFEWGMLYKETELPILEQRLRTHRSEPYRSPTHAGGLFAINRKYFLKLGAYDPGLLGWGGENFELSFKIWQCGGSIIWVPCSRIGHVYRKHIERNYDNLFNKTIGLSSTMNYKRVVETWFDDDHKKYFYTREPLARYLDMGNITDQLALKKRLNCKSFKWFMNHIAYDVYRKFPRLPSNLYWGELRSMVTDDCLESVAQQLPAPMHLTKCLGNGKRQLVRLNVAGQLGIGERCIEADGQGITLGVCHTGTVNGPWKYKDHSKNLVHRKHKKCMTLNSITQKLFLARCDRNDSHQKWWFKELRPK